MRKCILIYGVVGSICLGVIGAARADVQSDWSYIRKILQEHSTPQGWRDSEGRSVIFYHLLYGSEERALELLDKSPRVKVRKEGNIRLLEVAIRQGSQRIVKRLLELGESAGPEDNDERSPLMIAAEDGRHLEIMRMLLQAGANPNHTLHGETAVHRALRRGNVFGYYLLLEWGFDLKAEINKREGSTLLFALVDGRLAAQVDEFVDAGFDPDIPRVGGRTVLQHAAENLQGEMITELLAVGADPCICGSTGEYPEELYLRKLRKEHVNMPAEYRDVFSKASPCRGETAK